MTRATPPPQASASPKQSQQRTGPHSPQASPVLFGSPSLHSSSQEYSLGAGMHRYPQRLEQQPQQSYAYTPTLAPTDHHQPRFDNRGDVLPPPFAFALGTEWQTGLGHIMDDRDVCLEVLCCPYCQMGYQYNRTQKWFADMNTSICLAACCTDLFVLGMGYVFATYILRQRIVDRYKLTESTAATLTQSICCAPCTLCQTHREMTIRQECPGGVCIVCPFVAPPPLAPPMHGIVPYASRTTAHLIPTHSSPPAPSNPYYSQQHQPSLYSRSTDEGFVAPAYDVVVPTLTRGSPAKTASDTYPATPQSHANPETETPKSPLTSPTGVSGTHGESRRQFE